MARHKCIGIRQTLTTLLPKAEIERLAHESGAVRRRRKVDASAMLWTVLLGFGTGRERTLAGLRRTYERMTGKSLVPSSFYDRFSTELARMFRAVLRELMTKLAASEVRYAGVLEGFRDVLVADATVVKLHRLLARRFPGTRKNSSPAAAKLHLVMSASGTGAHKVKVTGERANDHRTLQMGPWVEGRLLLFDLGYFRYPLFDAIDRNGGYFITRLAATMPTRASWRECQKLRVWADLAGPSGPAVECHCSSWVMLRGPRCTGTGGATPIRWTGKGFRRWVSSGWSLQGAGPSQQCCPEGYLKGVPCLANRRFEMLRFARLGRKQKGKSPWPGARSPGSPRRARSRWG